LENNPAVTETTESACTAVVQEEEEEYVEGIGKLIQDLAN
jgi:hypothetical protein